MESADIEPMPRAARVPSFMLTPTVGYGLVASAALIAALVGMIPGALLVVAFGWGDVNVPLLVGSSAMLLALVAGVCGVAWGISKLQVARLRPLVVFAAASSFLLLATWIVYLAISSAGF